MNEASRYLQAIAKRMAAAYASHSSPRAILLTGSAAAGESDSYSDVDLVCYYDARPSEATRTAAREQVARRFGACQPARRHSYGGDWYAVHGVQCEVGHLVIGNWERDLAKVLDAHDPDPLLQKAVSGLLRGVPLHGEALIRGWQARAAAYPERLARAMVERHLRFLPVWRTPGYFAARDATLYFHQSLAEACLNVLGVLAGLNRQYYSTFQFKRMRTFIGTLHLAPPDLADRIERVIADAVARPDAAAQGVEALVTDTLALVEAHLPEVDTSSVRGDLGNRVEPWQLGSRNAP